MNTLINTPDDRLQTFLRLALGLIMFPHGAQKLLGWFGGNGFDATLGFFGAQLGVPAFIATLVVLAEFFGSLLLIAGAFSRLAALSIGFVMLGAMALVHMPNGFFWTNGGIEIHLLILTLVVAVVVRGSGAFSVDRTLSLRQADKPGGKRVLS